MVKKKIVKLSGMKWLFQTFQSGMFITGCILYPITSVLRTGDPVLDKEESIT